MLSEDTIDGYVGALKETATVFMGCEAATVRGCRRYGVVWASRCGWNSPFYPRTGDCGGLCECLTSYGWRSPLSTGGRTMEQRVGSAEGGANSLSAAGRSGARGEA